ncbi:hypothetical protein SAMN02745165_02813 [Malonomonas rubra DSM 5091]|uniref:Uncharacterized protein n=1 Tax=Malonomonas rubra DSM 5091 TaxID=1122189 RepID=A0A1M6KVM4_MALRU|nr:hypothetical protein [Malonomonas rubra]SHJ62999.1 hypothetical protein SAMN02745165_02813 [Malonomonas rubra DSM 5091]
MIIEKGIDALDYGWRMEKYIIQVSRGIDFEVFVHTKKGEFDYVTLFRIPKGMQLAGYGKTFHSKDEAINAYKSIRSDLGAVLI